MLLSLHSGIYSGLGTPEEEHSLGEERQKAGGSVSLRSRSFETLLGLYYDTLPEV